MKCISLHSAMSMMALLIFMGSSSCNRKDIRSDDQPLKLTSFYPSEAGGGAAVVLSGGDFFPDKERNEVTINGIKAVVTEVGEDCKSITVIVPEHAGSGKITVRSGDREAEFSQGFVLNVQAPVIYAFTPGSGPAGTKVLITGKNFNESTVVAFSRVVSSEVTFVSATTIEAIVPAGVITGKISVICDNLEALSPRDFIAAPTASTITPAKAQEGDYVEIEGSNFSPIPENNLVKFGTVVAFVEEATTNKLKVIVPANASNGKITISVNRMITQTTESFSLLATIFDFSPKFGLPNTVMKIRGKYFDESPIVMIGNVRLNVTKKDTEGIYVTVPFNAPVTKDVISVSSQGETVKTFEKFQITKPWRWLRTQNPFEFTEAAGVTFKLNNKIYLVQTRGLDRWVFEFDPLTASWQKLLTAIPNDIMGGNVGCAIVSSNKAYFGNFEGIQNRKIWYEFDPTKTREACWRRVADYPVNYAQGSTGFNLGGKMIVGLGNNIQTNESADFLMEFHPERANGNGDWETRLASNIQGRFRAFNFVINNVAYIGGGTGHQAEARKFYKYDPANFPNGVTALAPAPSASAYNIGVAFNGKGYLIDYNNTYEYSVANNTWTLAPYQSYDAFQCAYEVNGRVYAFDFYGEVYTFDAE